MPSNDQRCCVHAVAALTRFHYAGAHRRKFNHAAARDRRRSHGWGWHENVVGIGVTRKDGECCVTFFVLRKEIERRLLKRQRIPRRMTFDSIEGAVLTDVVEVPGRCVAHAARVRPIQPRSEVGHRRGGLGTLSLIVTKAGAPGTQLGMSCSHVWARSGALADFGRSVEQPADDTGEIVGTLTEDVSTLRSGTLATEDIALARLAIPANSKILGSDVTPTSFSPKTAGQFDVGTTTILYGTRTSKALGRVVAFQSTWDIAEMPFVNGHVEFSGLVAYETTSAKGDSGGLVMSGNPGEEGVVLGIHTAGREDGKLGLFQPVGPIMKRLKLELAT